jgi:hypothetical protein
MSDIRSWSTTAASNTDATTGGMAEGMAPSAVNDTGRTRMAAHRTQWEDAEWFDWGHVPAYVSASTFTVSNSVTDIYSIGRRLKILGIGSGALYGHVISMSAVSATNTKFTVSMTSGNLTSSLSQVAVAILNPTNTSLPKGAVLDTPTIATPVLNGNVSGTALAAQADMETPSSAFLVVAPSVVQYHPGVAKAWCNFNGTTGTARSAHGCTTARTGTGTYRVSFSTAFSGAGNYAAVVSHSSVNAGSQAWTPLSIGASSIHFETYYESPADNSQIVDPTWVMCVFFGDQ